MVCRSCHTSQQDAASSHLAHLLPHAVRMHILDFPSPECRQGSIIAKMSYSRG